MIIDICQIIGEVVGFEVFDLEASSELFVASAEGPILPLPDPPPPEPPGGPNWTLIITGGLMTAALSGLAYGTYYGYKNVPEEKWTMFPPPF